MASGELGVVEADKEEVVPFGTAVVESSEDTYGKTALLLDTSPQREEGIERTTYTHPGVFYRANKKLIYAKLC